MILWLGDGEKGHRLIFPGVYFQGKRGFYIQTIETGSGQEKKC
jgi:hypothetical protein